MLMFAEADEICKQASKVPSRLSET